MNKIFICLAAALLFAACDSGISQEELEEQARLNDTYHLENIEFFLDADDGLTVYERPDSRRATYVNETSKKIDIAFKEENTFTSTFYFDENQPYTLAVDTTQKYRVPVLLENNTLYMGQDEVWTFRNSEEEERLTGGYHAYRWDIASKHQTVVDRTITTRTIVASFQAYFIGENTQAEVVVEGKWKGNELKYSNYHFNTDVIE